MINTTTLQIWAGHHTLRRLAGPPQNARVDDCLDRLFRRCRPLRVFLDNRTVCERWAWSVPEAEYIASFWYTVSEVKMGIHYRTGLHSRYLEAYPVDVPDMMATLDDLLAYMEEGEDHDILDAYATVQKSGLP